MNDQQLRRTIERDLRFTLDRQPREPLFYIVGDGEDSVFAVGANERLFDYDDDRFYRAYRIAYNPQRRVPDRRFDFQFSHVCYDGPGDPRCGAAASVEAAMREIDELYEEGN